MREMTLEERKQVSLNILIEIDRLCRDNNIQYYLAYGTLIGAVRHKGFIPWDDDIDLWLKWKDYLKLVELCKSTRFDVLSPESSDDYPLLFTKISDPNTIVKTNGSNKLNFNRGISIDLFPLINDNNKLPIKLSYYFFLLTICKKIVKFQNYNFNRKFWKKKLFNYLSGKEMTDETMLVSIMSPYIRFGKDRHESILFSESVELEFEHCKFYAPKGYDKILRNIYGDYMKLPPKDKQISNHDTTAFWI